MVAMVAVAMVETEAGTGTGAQLLRTGLGMHPADSILKPHHFVNLSPMVTYDTYVGVQLRSVQSFCAAWAS